MSDIFNVQDLFGIEEPAGCVTEESSCEDSVGMDEVLGTSGEYERVCPKPYGETVAQIRGRGDMPHATLTAGSVGLNEAFITSRIRREKNDAEPSFEITQESYYDPDETDSGADPLPVDPTPVTP